MTRLISYLIPLAFSLSGASMVRAQDETVNIGLLLPDQSQLDRVHAAELAIEEANRAGGYGDREFRLQVRTAEGFWGAGSKESVSLVYEDDVRAIVGALDGRNGHLAEQVATKSHLSYIETYATEPTLSQAFVPWFMRVVPNDNQQALAIVDQIRQQGKGRVVILSTGTYDCRYAIKSLTRTLAREAMSPVVIPLEKDQVDRSAIKEKILQNDPDHLIIPFDASHMSALMKNLGELKPELKIYGTIHFSFGVERRKEEWKLYEGAYLIGPLFYDQSSGSPGDSQAAFLYDAVNLVINAIRKVGTEREAITAYISGSTYTDGATGSISFDDLGNRKDAARLYQIIGGVPQLIQ